MLRDQYASDTLRHLEFISNIDLSTPFRDAGQSQVALLLSQLTSVDNDYFIHVTMALCSLPNAFYSHKLS